MKKLIFLIALIGFTTISLNSNGNSMISIRKTVLSDSTQKKIIDPVCNMKIKQTGSKTTTFNKVSYYFCSESCKQKFLAEPSKYVKK
ncbi:YHS domain-containing protein [Pedobacter aquatilis]|uniref:YHS domain-containing protein n=1 Tax=Pedobacter aquatilis TaxID=351343 RepID=UPI00292D70A4|nr:YHS domain-containing protein [Pedobacter aquatilis]